MIESILKAHGFDISERPDHSLCLCCPRCATFYSKFNAPLSELVPDEKSMSGAKEVFFCNCHNSTEQLNDAHEIGFNTPAMQWEYEALSYIERKLDNQRDEILDLMKNYSD